MSDQGGQAQTPPTPQVGASRSPAIREAAIHALSMHVFGGVSPGGGKFTMDIDQMNASLKQWSQFLEKLQEDARTARPMTQVKPAGSDLDAAGKSFADGANRSGQAYVNANLAAQRYVKGYIDKLTVVLNAHTEVDQSNAQQFNQINQSKTGQPDQKGK
ncbi:hypothetical protein [Kutzneria sp. NPDC052558]|uniref:hypothetical protein n=1 Tax=Kutzneria sp. NPDC052558 TaxID=3364121 RepID=UPI0037CA5205